MSLQGNFWYTFLLEAESNPGFLNTVRTNRSLENFQGAYQESNPEPPVLCRSTSTDGVVKNETIIS